MIRTEMLALALAMCALAVPAFSSPPPAALVKAEVHAASTIAIELLALTPTSGAVADETAVAQMVGASGLGEVMGWGQDHWDSVEAAVAQTVTAHFQAAFKELEAFDGAGLTYAQLTGVVGNLSGHFGAIRTAVASPDGAPEATAQALRQVQALSKLLAFHVKELPDSPLVSTPRVGVALALRTIRGGARALVIGLDRFPQLAEKVRAELAQLEALGENPPACAAQPTKPCVTEIVRKALPLLEKIEKTLK